jgi:polyhydroxybutyrate depolymerase
MGFLSPRGSSPRRALAAAGLLGGSLLAGGCSSSKEGGGGGTTGGATTAATTTSTTTTSSTAPPQPDLQGRAYDLIAPAGIDKTMPVPLVVMLHGYTDHGTTNAPWTDMDTYMKVSPETQKRGWLLALGHGDLDMVLNHFYWNATDACCDFQHANPDDVGYILGIIADVKKTYAVDAKRVYAFGHSNGGFMVNRLACNVPDFAAVVSLAGETYLDQKRCAAPAPVTYLQVQGDADMTVPYAGGHPEGVSILPLAPGAVETTQDWAAKNKCAAQGDTSQPPITLMSTSTAPDTTKVVYGQCEAGGGAELWTIHGGEHSPPFNDSWAPSVLDFMAAHPKP